MLSVMLICKMHWLFNGSRQKGFLVVESKGKAIIPDSRRPIYVLTLLSDQPTGHFLLLKATLWSGTHETLSP